MKEVVFVTVHPGTVFGQEEAVGLPVQKLPPLAFIGSLSGLSLKERLSLKAVDFASWGAARGAASAAGSTKETTVWSFIMRENYERKSLVVRF